MHDRVLGFEQEFGTRPGTLNVAHVADFVSQLGLVANKDGFANNGFRFYLDHSHIEICTPEALNPFDAVAAYFASLLYAQKMYGMTSVWGGVETEPLRMENLTRDAKGNAWGLHENYKTDLPTYDPRIAHVIGSALVGRFIYASGWIERTQKGLRVRRSQRTHTLEQFTGGSTTDRRPLVNTREYPERFHNINDGACMLPWGPLHRMNMLDDLLTLVEMGVKMDDLILEKPLKQAVFVGYQEPDDDTWLRLANARRGDRIRLSELNRAFVERILSHLGSELPASKILMHEENYDALEQFGAAEQITRDSVSDKLAHPWDEKVDAISKKEYLIRREIRAEQRGADAESAKKAPTVEGAQKINEMWHTMDPSKNIVMKLRNAGLYHDKTGVLDKAEAIVEGESISDRSRRRAKYVEELHRLGILDMEGSKLDWRFAILPKEADVPELKRFGYVTEESDADSFRVTFW